mmetsp:Transcript_19938/g.49529  ORF Transcript_19938/g.49529 Transcript_19938/m.49529 type:complete len:259 (-) Transcript_19938:382-1158(-)
MCFAYAESTVASISYTPIIFATFLPSPLHMFSSTARHCSTIADFSGYASSEFFTMPIALSSSSESILTLASLLSVRQRRVRSAASWMLGFERLRSTMAMRTLGAPRLPADNLLSSLLKVTLPSARRALIMVSSPSFFWERTPRSNSRSSSVIFARFSSMKEMKRIAEHAFSRILSVPGPGWSRIAPMTARTPRSPSARCALSLLTATLRTTARASLTTPGLWECVSSVLRTELMYESLEIAARAAMLELDALASAASA